MDALTVVRATGDPERRGRMIGRGLRDPIGRSLDFYRRYLARRGVATDALEGLLAPYLAAAQARVPAMVATLRGMAEGARAPFAELFAVNAFEELEPLVEPGGSGSALLGRPNQARCSTFTVAGPGVTLLGHNEHWLAGDAGNVALVLDLPDDGGPAIASPTVVCCLPATGMNALGGAQGIQSLTAADDRKGIPRVMVSRGSLNASSPERAVELAAPEGRAGGYGHSVAFRGGACLTVETTATRRAVLPGPGAHTNHYLDPDLARMETGRSEGSVRRHERLSAVLASDPPRTAVGVMGILRGHDEPWVGPEGADADESGAIVFSTVCDLEAGRMWVAPGDPRTIAYEEVDLTGVVSPATV